MSETRRIRDEIREGPDAIRATLDAAAPAAAEAVATMRARDIRRLHVIGNGTSYHSSLACATLYRQTASLDDPVVVARTAGDFRTYRPDLGTGDAVLGISASGEFRDVVAVAEALQGIVPFIGVVHVADSSLARLADCVVTSSGGPSDVPVMTKTFSATLVAAELVVLGMLDSDRAGRVVAAISRAADHAERAIEAAERDVSQIADQLDGVEHLFVVGSGVAHIAAMEAALKLKEVALVHAEPTETWEMTSGASTVIGAATVVVAIAPQGAGRSATAEVVRHAADWGARIVEVGPDQMVPGSSLLELPTAAQEDHSPLTAVPPIVLLADELARRHGLDPDRPGWVERYRSQGLTHIMGA